jgi:outer membrane protein TolC
MNPLLGEFRPFSWYYVDQKTESILLEAPVYSGRLEEGKLYLTESEAIAMALVNNLEINVERHARLSSDWDLALQEAFYDPKGTFGFNWNRATNPTSSLLQGGPSVTDILTDYQFGYSHPFKTGTTFEVSFLGNRNRTTNFFSSLIPAIGTQFQVLFRQDLLKGFWKASAEYEIEISKNNIDITEQAFKEKVTDVVVQVQDRFWELEYSLQDLEVRKKSLEYAQTVLDQNQARFEVGTASRLEVVQSEAEVASRKEELISAQFVYRRVQDQLVQLITDFEDPRTFRGEIVPVSTSGLPASVSEPFDELLEFASEFRPELQQVDLNTANFQVRLNQARDELRPSLQLTGGYMQFGLGGTLIERDFSQGFIDAPVVSITPGGLGDSLSQLFSTDYKGYVVGLTLDLPIKNTDARARNAKAQIDLRRSELQKRAQKQVIALEIRDALTLVEGNQARLEAADATVNAARERLEGEEARFEVGLGTTRELIEAQRDALSAVSVQVRAKTDLIKSHAALDRAVGRTFQRHNIALRDTLDRNVQKLKP